MNKLNKGRIAFNIFLLIFTLFIVLISLGYEVKPSLFPLIVGVATLLLVVPVLVDDIHPIPFLRRFDISIMGAGSEDISDEKSEKIFNRGVLIVVLSLIGFFIAVILVGFYVGISLFTFIFLKSKRRGHWLQAVVTTAIVVVLIYVIFGLGMEGVFLFEGIFLGEILPSI